jgi:hypothetical protein
MGIPAPWVSCDGALRLTGSTNDVVTIIVMLVLILKSENCRSRRCRIAISVTLRKSTTY